MRRTIQQHSVCLLKLTSLALLIALGGVAFGADLAHPGGLVCDAPKSPLYRKSSTNDAIQIQLIGDFDNLSTTKTAAVLAWKDASSPELKFMPVYISKRGNSRGSYCEMKPMRISFTDAAIRADLESKMSEKGRRPSRGSFNYLKTYLETFIAGNYTLNEVDAKAPADSPFAHLGDDMKFVTHCGKSTGWDLIGAPTVEKQNERLLSEYYLYEILGILKAPVESLRLAETIYVNPNGSPRFYTSLIDGPSSADSRFGFFREPPNSLAKRCGLHSKNPVQLDPGFDDLSAFSLEFLNKFAHNNDYSQRGHNVNILFDARGYKFVGPYDFDLSGIVHDGYANNPATFEYNSRQFRELLKRGNQDWALAHSQRVLNAQNEIQQLIEAANLSTERKQRFQNWLQVQMRALMDFVSDAAKKPATDK